MAGFDQLFGKAGDDLIHGNGRDIIDGGGSDELHGDFGDLNQQDGSKDLIASSPTNTQQLLVRWYNSLMEKRLTSRRLRYADEIKSWCLHSDISVVDDITARGVTGLASTPRHLGSVYTGGNLGPVRFKT